MSVITVARKPLSEGNVARNALVHGCGALHVDISRIHTGDNLNGGAYSQGSPRHDGKENWRYERGKAGEFTPPSGRWPANIILVHHGLCQESECHAGCTVTPMDSHITRFFKHVQ